jgi:WD40 repeat protein
MRPFWPGAGVLVVLASFQVSQPACHGQQPKAVLQVEGGRVWSVAFRPDGRTVAVGCDGGRIELWEVATSKRRATLRGHTDRVNSLAFSGNGRLLVSGSRDGTVRIWDMTAAKEKAVLRGHKKAVYALALSHDGN